MKLKEEANKRGMVFEGNTNSGRFAGDGIEGRYWLTSPQIYTIQILKKPIWLSIDRIKEEFEKYLRDFI